MAKPEYQKKVDGLGGVAGYDYQFDLLQFFLLQGFSRNDEFELWTEIKGAGTFDDLVYKTKDGKLILLQAKHTEGGISFENLFSNTGKGAFNLYKYIEKIAEINSNFNLETNDSVKEKYLLLATSGEFNLNNINDSLKTKLNLFNNKNLLVKKNLDIDYLISSIDGMKCYSFAQNQDLVDYIFTNAKDKTKDKRLIKLFFDKLLLVTISSNDLNDRIAILSKELNIGDKLKLDEKVKEWFKEKKGKALRKINVIEYRTHIESQRYNQSNSKILDLISAEYSKKLVSDDYPENIEDNVVLLKIKNENSYILHLFKIQKLLEQGLLFLDKSNTKLLHDKIIFVKPQTPDSILKEIFATFILDKYVYLIVPIFDNFEKLDVFKNELEAISKKDYKRIIFITTVSNDGQLENLFQNIRSVEGNIKLSDYSDPVQGIILEREINFQNNKTSLKNLFNNKDIEFDKILDEFTLLQLISKEKISVNENCEAYLGIPEKIQEIPRTFLGKELEEYNEEGFCSDIISNPLSTPFVTILDFPGMGKSTVLNKLYRLLRQEPYWIIKMNLNSNKYVKKLCELSKANQQVSSLESFLNFLEFPERTRFENNIFNISKMVVLVLDALDEISSDYSKLIFDILSKVSLEENVRKIVLTSRHHNHEFKNYIASQIFTLKPLSKDESVDLLSSFWCAELDNNNTEKTREFANNLIEIISHSVGWKDIKTFLEIPLHAKMIGDIFKENCRDHLNNSAKKIELPSNITLPWLCEKFIENKMKIFINEKCEAEGRSEVKKSLENTFVNLYNEHLKLALKLEFPKHYKSFKIFHTSNACINESLLNMGLLIKCEDDNVQFVHKTFAEYMVSKYIFNLKSTDEIFDIATEVLLNWIIRLKNVYYEDNNTYLTVLINKLANKKEENPVHDKKMVELYLNHIFDKEGNTPLHYAVKNGSKKIVEDLLNNEHPTDVFDKEGNTPLHYAVKNHHNQMVKLLLDKGHSVNVFDKRGNTPLHYAVKNDDIEIMKCLLDKGLPDTLYDKEGDTPLHFSVKEGNKTKVEILLIKEHPIGVVDRTGNTPLHYAVKNGNNEITKALLNKGLPSVLFDAEGSTPLHYAVKNENNEIVKLLLDKEHSINVVDGKGNTPLYYAVKNEDTEITEVLLDKGLPDTLYNKEGDTPLHFAVKEDNKKVVKILLIKGHSFYVVDKKGNTPLHHAVKNGYTEITEDLLDKGLPSVIYDSEGNTPLHYAIKNGDNRIVNLLLIKGHPINIFDKNGTALLEFAGKHDYSEINVLKQFLP